MKILARALGNLLAYAALKLLLALTTLLPTAMALSLARLLGRIYCAMSRRRKIAMRNLDIAFRDTITLKSKQLIVLRSFEHFMGSVLWFVLRDRYARDVDGLFEISPVEDSLLRSSHSGGLVFLSAHVGDWEMAHHYLALRGIHVAVVTRKIANPFIDREVARRRANQGARTIAKEGALMALRQALRRGEPVGLLADQNCPARQRFFDFLGTPASSYTDFARVLARTTAPILFITCMRKDHDSRFQVVVRDLGSNLPATSGLTSPQRARVRADALVRHYLLVIEELTRSHPEQYLWIHRRWKSRPTGAPWLYHDLERPLNLALLDWKPGDAIQGKRVDPP